MDKKQNKRINIIGGPGTGKTTLAEKLSKILALPVCHIDGIHYLPNWQIRDKERRDAIILQKIEEEKWILDGIYTTTLEKRIQKADCNIFLCYSTLAQLKGILSRYRKGRGKEKAEIPGCKEKMDWKFFWFTICWNYRKRKKIRMLLEKYPEKENFIFTTRKKLQKWYNQEFNLEKEQETVLLR